MLFFRKHGVLEKRAGAQAIRVSGRDEHALERTDMAHSLARFGEIRWRFAALEVALEISISDTRFALGGERVGHAENDESSAVRGVEDAGAVAEPASFGAEFAH